MSNVLARIHYRSPDTRREVELFLQKFYSKSALRLKTRKWVFKTYHRKFKEILSKRKSEVYNGEKSGEKM